MLQVLAYGLAKTIVSYPVCRESWSWHKAPGNFMFTLGAGLESLGREHYDALILDLALPDGSGAVMVDGKMQDDASWKQCKVMVDLARLIADKDPEYKALYGF